MEYPNISGAWLSKTGKLVYIITQLEDKFVWRVVHEKGVTETGIGWFKDPHNVEAQWNFHGGKLGKGIKTCTGEIAKDMKQILWKDGDHFMKRIPNR